MKRALPALVLAAALAACHGAADPAASIVQDDTSAGTCDPAFPLVALSRLENVAVVPPRLFGVVDPQGGPWSGLSLENMEQAFCTSDPISEDEQTVTAGWGQAPDYEVTVQYFKKDHQIDFFQLNAGYKGTLDFASRPTALEDASKPNPFGQHTYSIGVGRPLLRDGQPWLIDWKNVDVQATEILDGLMFTFAPELISTQTSCRKQGTCLATVLSEQGEGIIGARPLGIYLHVPNVNAPQPAASTPDYLYGFPVKMTPFSLADAFLKLDAEGPTATAADLGQRHRRCVMKLGMTFSSFLSDCVDVLSDSQANAALEKKIVGSATRTVATTKTAALQAWWSLDVTGVHPEFASERFDEQAPPANAPASGLVFDDRSAGKYLNDYSADGATLTLVATGAIYREYARLTQAFVQSQMAAGLPRFPLGDPKCLLPQGGDPATWRPAPGCTGIEQLVTPADPSTTTDPGVQRLSLGTDGALGLGISSILRPGVINVFFCRNPADLDLCSTYTGAGGFGDTRAQVIAVLGNGDVSSLPEAVRDRKAYVRLWAKAFVKYLRAAGQNPADLSDPKFDALTPADGEITIDSVQGELLSVKYLDKLEWQVNYLTGAATRLIFH